MGLFGRKKRKTNEFGMEVISVEEALRSKPIKVDQNARYNSACEHWDSISLYDTHKLFIEKYMVVGDVFVNKVGMKVYLARKTKYELVFNAYSTDSHFATYHKWDYHAALRMGLGFEKVR